MLFYLFIFFNFFSSACRTSSPQYAHSFEMAKDIEIQVQKKNWNKVIEMASTFRTLYPYSKELKQVILWEADAYFTTQQYLDAAFTYEEFNLKYPTAKEGQHTKFRIAESYEYLAPESHDRDRYYVFLALEHYQRFLDECPAHPLRPKAAHRIAKLTKSIVASMKLKGELYFKQEKYHSGILVLEDILKTYRDNLSEEEKNAIYRQLSEGYRKLVSLKQAKPHEVHNQLTDLLSTEELLERAEKYAKQASEPHTNLNQYPQY